MKTEEWDFRKVPEAQVGATVIYECLRSSPTAIKAADDIRDRLQIRNPKETRAKVEAFIGESAQPTGQHLFAAFLAANPDFPAPAVSDRVGTGARRRLSDSGLSMYGPAEYWAQQALKAHQHPNDELFRGLGYVVRVAVVDIKKPTDQLVEEFAAWVAQA